MHLPYSKRRSTSEKTDHGGSAAAFEGLRGTGSAVADKPAVPWATGLASCLVTSSAGADGVMPIATPDVKRVAAARRAGVDGTHGACAGSTPLG